LDAAPDFVLGTSAPADDSFTGSYANLSLDAACSSGD
jgi:hypothetical protein